MNESQKKLYKLVKNYNNMLAEFVQQGFAPGSAKGKSDATLMSREYRQSGMEGLSRGKHTKPQSPKRQMNKPKPRVVRKRKPQMNEPKTSVRIAASTELGSILDRMVEAKKKATKKAARLPLKTTSTYDPETRKTTKTETNPNYPEGHPLRTRTSGTYKDISDLERRVRKGTADYT